MGIQVLGVAGAYIFGLLWCYSVCHRFPQDIRDIFLQKHAAQIAAIVFVWIITVIIALALILYTRVMIHEMIALVRTL